MNPIEIIRSQDEFSPTTATAIFSFIYSIWPPAEDARPIDMMEKLAEWKARGSTHFIIRGNAANPIVAHSMIFKREIFTEAGPLTVGALAGVCSHPDFRGQGLGAAVARAALDYLPELGVEVSLFQTGVPEFYEKLGGRAIENNIYNGDNPEPPFWSEYAIIYPASYAWPNGPIDLNGVGY